MSAVYLDRLFRETLRRELKKEFVRRDQNGEVVDTKLVVTASEATKCVRALNYDRRSEHAKSNDEDEDDDNNISPGYFLRGREMEKWMVRVMKRVFGKENVQYAGREQVTFVDYGVGLAGTPDGIISFTLDYEHICAVVEIKTTDSAVMEPKRAHKMQLAVNMILARMHGIKVTTGYLYYVNSSNWLQIDLYEVPMAEAIELYKTAKIRAENAINRDVNGLPFEGAATRECTQCPYRPECLKELGTRKSVSQEQKEEIAARMHGRMSIARFPEFSDEEDRMNCETSFMEFMQSREIAAQAEKDMELHREEAKRWVANNGGEADYEDKRARLSYTDRTSWDTEAMRKALAGFGVDEEQMEQFKKVTPIEMIRLVKKKENKSA